MGDALIRCHRLGCQNPLTWENHQHGQLACDDCMERKWSEMVESLIDRLTPDAQAHVRARLAVARQGGERHG